MGCNHYFIQYGTPQIDMSPSPDYNTTSKYLEHFEIL